MSNSYMVRPEVVPGNIYTTMIMANPSPKLKNGIPLTGYRIEDFGVSSTENLLLPVELAELAHEGLRRAVTDLGVTNDGLDLYAQSTFDADTGCVYVPGERSRQEAAELITELVTITNRHGNTPLDSPEEIPDLRLCDQPECVNPRHYDLEIGSSLRQFRQDLDSRLYLEMSDGRVITAWGDELPSSDFSRRLLLDLRHESVPFRDDNEGKLTPSQLASIKFVPLTGCWAGDKYYRGDDIDLGNKTFQFDGYSRLYDRFSQKSKAHKLGHRIIWAIYGGTLEYKKVLNHRCGYRRCCNPLHIEQLSTSENNSHGLDMAKARYYARHADSHTRHSWWKSIIDNFTA